MKISRGKKMKRKPYQYPYLGVGKKMIISATKRVNLIKGKKKEKMTGVRKWEDMNQDCLIEIFKRVGGLKSLAIDLPCVCKSWYKATLNPVLWTSLDFQKLYDETCGENVRLQVSRGTFCQSIPFRKLINCVVDRSCGTATECVLPESCDLEDLHYILDRSPGLRFLDIPSLVLRRFPDKVPEMIGKLEALEVLQWGHAVSRGDCSIEETLRQISLHCKKFSSLTIYGSYSDVDSDVGDNEVAALTKFAPTIKCLKMSEVRIGHWHLKQILSGCRELEKLDISHCDEFDESDKEMIEMASNIKSFNCKRTRHYDEVRFFFYDDEDLFLGDDDVSDVASFYSGADEDGELSAGGEDVSEAASLDGEADGIWCW